jgi:molybdate transport system permease protein
LSHRLAQAGATCALALLLILLVTPVAAIFAKVGPSQLLASLDNPVAVDALVVSLQATGIALAIIVTLGTPAAYILATRRFRGRSVLMTVLDLPLVLPPAVAGLGLLVATSPGGPVGDLLAPVGRLVALTPLAVVLALTFVAAPFYVRAAVAAIGAVDPALPETARTLGASELSAALRIHLPLALPGLAAGATLAAGRALGEFGATILFAGSIQGVTQTLPLAIYETFPTDLTAALAMSVILIAMSGTILLATHVLTNARDRRRDPARFAPAPG